MSKRRRNNKRKKKEEEASKNPKINYDLMIRENLTDFELNFDKTGVCFTSLIMKGNKLKKPLDSLGSAFGTYKNLKRIDLSNNNLSDFSICKEI